MASPARAGAARILVVEDESHLAKGIQFNLEVEGYEVEVVPDGAQALARLTGPQRGTFDLVLLDIMLPGVDGLGVVNRMREAGNYTPVLMLTAKGLPEDVVSGLEAGADDYLAKPFDLGVLLARVKGLLRRRDWARGGADVEAARIGEAEVDFRNLQIKSAGRVVPLTVLEAMLLKLLVSHAGQVVTKGEILQKVWNMSADTETRAVDNFIVRLRRHLGDDPRFPRHLETVRGIGYRLVL
ncbi:MAG TPA: response regulator transcription factor [Vicinamibacteria bacterium]|nr:response regulator transcription factor [Vicinamibacteria bacterium]